MTEKTYPPLPITAAQLADLRIVFAAPPEEILRVDSAVRSQPSPPVRTTHLFEIARKSVREQTLAEAIVRQAVGLCAFTNRSGMSAKNVIMALEAGLAQKDGWRRPEDRRELDRHLGALLRLLDNEAIYLAAKAIELSYDHDRVFTGARVITDIRPVLDESRKEPRGAVISHTLRISYFQDNKPVELTIALDQDDLKTLITVCQDGLSKTDVVKRMITGVSMDNVFVAGDENYGSS